MGLLGSLFTRIKDPVPATAQVVSASAYRGDGTWQNCHLTLVVQAPGLAPFSAEHDCLAPAAKWPHPGQSLPLIVERADPAKLKIDWDQVAAGRDAARQQADALARAMGGQASFGTSGAGIGANVQVVSATGEPVDPAQAKEAVARAEQALGIDLDGDGVVGSSGGESGSGTQAAPSDDPLAQIERLAKLRDDGVLTETEFQAQKAKLLDKI